MSDHNPATETEEHHQTGNYVDVYKKWHTRGFCNIQYWPGAHRIIIDIGTTKDEKLVDNAKCFVPAGQFMACLSADLNNRIESLYPDFFSEKQGEGGAAWYGGMTTSEGVISRVFKVTTWPNKEGARAFKCGFFEGRKTGAGAITPNYSNPLKNERIMMTRKDLAELFEDLNVSINASRVKFNVGGTNERND